ncbi:MAG: hypothetical protein OEV26_04995, partial [Gallionella sp.]|nr:hypothetical protein [Gallionella sp.]
MNDQSTPPENIEPASAEKEMPSMPEKQPPARKARLTARLARLGITQVALALLAVVFLWQWQSGQRAIGDMQQQLAKKIAEMDGNGKANQLVLAQSQEQVRELAAKVATLESRSAESHNQRAALEALYADMSVSRDESALAEVEQMLLIAAQQLQLSANVKVAMIAMQSADARLQRLNRP